MTREDFVKMMFTGSCVGVIDCEDAVEGCKDCYRRHLEKYENKIYNQAIDDFGRALYHEAFETDTDLKKWDSGCWIRFKMVENVAEQLKKGIDNDN